VLNLYQSSIRFAGIGNGRSDKRIGAASGEMVVFLGDFNRLRDPRQPGKVTYPLVDILLLRLLAVTARAEGFTAEPSTPLTAILPAKHAEQLSQQANRAYQLRKWLGR
jgi:hypothetical protein